MWRRKVRGDVSATTGLDQAGPSAGAAVERRWVTACGAPCCPPQPACSPQRSHRGEGGECALTQLLLSAGLQEEHSPQSPPGTRGRQPEKGPLSANSKQWPTQRARPSCLRWQVDPHLGRSFPIPAQTL